MSQIKRVVSIGAHSLDAELLGGPLLLKYARQGAHCTCLHVTQGRLEDPNATQEEKDAYLKELLVQNEKAARELGADTLWLGYVSSNMPSLDAFSHRLEQYFEEEQVDLVITHWRGSMHPRHINTHDAVTEADVYKRQPIYMICRAIPTVMAAGRSPRIRPTTKEAIRGRPRVYQPMVFPTTEPMEPR